MAIVYTEPTTDLDSESINAALDHHVRVWVNSTTKETPPGNFVFCAACGFWISNDPAPWPN